MTANSSSLTAGAPRFTDPVLTEIARTSRLEAAWREALDRGPHASAAGVTGDFSVAVTNPDGSAFLAVDRFSTHSLCYRVVGNSLRFAARADELADGAEIDPQAIFDFLYFHIIPSPRTIFKDVYRLPAGHYALFSEGQLTVAPYWTPSFEERRGVSFAELKTEFRGLLKEAVGSRLDGGKPGCFFSGGTDSSTVAGMIREASGRQPSTYSIGFEAEGYDEMAFARIAAKQFDTDHHEYYVTPADLVRSVPEVASFYDQPFGNSSALPSFYCARMAREDGVSKILAGDGGDELFGGNTRYARQKVLGFYDDLPAGLRSSLLEPLAAQSAMQRLPLVGKLASYVNQAKVALPDRMQTSNLLETLGLQTVLTPQFLAQVDASAPRRQQHEVWALSRAPHLLDRMLAYDWRYTLAETDLPKVCGTTQLAGLGVGFPMLDDDLLEFALRLPVDYKLKGLKLRWFFKEALRGFLPDQILSKKKQGFGLPFGVWANSHPALHAMATDSLHSLARRGIVRTAFVDSLLTQRLPEHPGYFGEMVWILMMLEQWLAAKAPDYTLAGS